MNNNENTTDSDELRRQFATGTKGDAAADKTRAITDLFGRVYLFDGPGLEIAQPKNAGVVDDDFFLNKNTMKSVASFMHRQDVHTWLALEVLALLPVHHNASADDVGCFVAHALDNPEIVLAFATIFGFKRDLGDFFSASEEARDGVALVLHEAYVEAHPEFASQGCGSVIVNLADLFRDLRNTPRITLASNAPSLPIVSVKPKFAPNLIAGKIRKIGLPA